MSLSPRFTTLVGASALMIGSSASADVTAAQVWEDWQRSLAIYGEDTISIGSTSMIGDTLTVSDVTMRLVDETTTTIIDMGDMVFTEAGDGTVDVTLPEQYPIIATNEDGSGGVRMTVTQGGLTTKVSGDPSRLVYDISAERYAFSMDEITVDDTTIDMDVRIGVNDMSGTYISEPGDIGVYGYILDAGSLDFVVDTPEGENNQDRVTVVGQASNLSINFDYTVPAGGISENPAELFSSGLTLNGGYAYDGADMTIDMVSDGASFSTKLGLANSAQQYDISDNMLRYSGESNGVSIDATGASLPFPIAMTLAAFSSSFVMPMGETDEPADFGISLGIEDLQVSDMIWSMLDPTNALPHDPATLLFELSGKMRLLMDGALAQEQLLENDGAVPAEVYSLDLDTLKLDIIGALLTGEGSFTFDNSDLDSFDGMPRPEGTATFTLTGLNALIDNLVSMGLVPADQAMMGRMMTGMFARSTGDDELTTTVEINGQGHVIANGQRLQ